MTPLRRFFITRVLAMLALAALVAAAVGTARAETAPTTEPAASASR